MIERYGIAISKLIAYIVILQHVMHGIIFSTMPDQMMLAVSGNENETYLGGKEQDEVFKLLVTLSGVAELFLFGYLFTILYQDHHRKKDKSLMNIVYIILVASGICLALMQNIMVNQVMFFHDSDFYKTVLTQEHLNGLKISIFVVTGQTLACFIGYFLLPSTRVLVVYNENNEANKQVKKVPLAKVLNYIAIMLFFLGGILLCCFPELIYVNTEFEAMSLQKLVTMELGIFYCFFALLLRLVVNQQHQIPNDKINSINQLIVGFYLIAHTINNIRIANSMELKVPTSSFIQDLRVQGAVISMIAFFSLFTALQMTIYEKTKKS